MTDFSRGPRKDARTRELISTFRTSDSETERSQALETVTRLHMPLARSLAHRYAGKGLDRPGTGQRVSVVLREGALTRLWVRGIGDGEAIR